MKILMLFLSVLLIVSCDDDCKHETSCPTEDTMNNFPWLVDLKESMTDCGCEISIIKGTYKNQTVIYTAITDHLCDFVNAPTLYNCNGQLVRSFSLSEQDQKDLANLKADTVLYRCEN